MSRQHWFAEIAKILRLAVPLIIANVAMVGMEIIDTLMAGQASREDLAGLAVGGNIWLIIEICMGGLISAVTPRIARFYGAKQAGEVTHETQQALLMGAVLGIAAMMAMLAVVPMVPLLGTEAEVTEIAQGYTRIIAFSLPASAICWVLFCLLEGHGMMRFAVTSSLIALAANLVLDYLFVFGKLGFPALGGVGCAWTTTTIYWLWTAACIIYTVKQPMLARYAIYRNRPRVDWQRWRAILALGLPISLALLAEEGFFNVTALLIAPLGTEPLGAHQITIQLVALVLMFSLGTGQATAILVAQSKGEAQPQAAYLHVKVGLSLVAVTGLSAGMLVFIFRDKLPYLFTQDLGVAAISSAIMLLAPIYLAYDALQIWATQTLRGFEDTKVPMLFHITAYWLFGFPLGYSLGVTQLWGESYGIYGFWGGLLAGILIGGTLLCSRLYLKAHRLRISVETVE